MASKALCRILRVDGLNLTLEHQKDGCYFENGQAIEIGPRDTGELTHEATVARVDRNNGVLLLQHFDERTQPGDFVFTSPPGMQLGSPWEAWREAGRREREWLERVWEALKSRGDR